MKLIWVRALSGLLLAVLGACGDSDSGAAVGEPCDPDNPCGGNLVCLAKPMTPAVCAALPSGCTLSELDTCPNLDSICSPGTVSGRIRLGDFYQVSCTGAPP